MRSHGSPHLAAGTILLLAAGLGLCGAEQRRGASVPPLVMASLQEKGPSASGWPTYLVGEAPPELQPAIRRGDLLIVTLQGALLTNLRRDLDAGGAELAIQSCHLAAIAATNRIGRNEGIAAGRTAARLRNPTNAPRPWAAEIVRRFADRPSADVAGFAVDLGDRVGVLRPIREQSICAPCHGSEQKMSPRLLADLAERYPVDRATGFRDGDIRGWWWVEIPKAGRSASLDGRD